MWLFEHNIFILWCSVF